MATLSHCGLQIYLEMERPKVKWYKVLITNTIKIALWFFAISILWVLIYKWVDPPITHLMLKRKMEAFIDGKPHEIQYKFVAFENVSSNLKMAVIAAEDQKFDSHFGFDFEAIDSAIDHNKRSKRKRGASTISQQTAKNVFLWDGKNFIRKGLEAYFTLLIECIWGKERILEVYLNVAEMGNLTFGVEAASRRYFYKSAKATSLSEASAIAAILPNPLLFKVKSPTKYIIKKKTWIRNQYYALGGKKYLENL